MIRLILLESIYYFYRVLSIAILVYCIGSWFVRPGQKLFVWWQKLGMLLDPLFKPARTLLYKFGLLRTVDFSPWLTCILLELIYSVLVRILI